MPHPSGRVNVPVAILVPSFLLEMAFRFFLLRALSQLYSGLEEPPIRVFQTQVVGRIGFLPTRMILFNVLTPRFKEFHVSAPSSSFTDTPGAHFSMASCLILRCVRGSATHLFLGTELGLPADTI